MHSIIQPRESRPRPPQERRPSLPPRGESPLQVSQRLVLRTPHEDDIDALAHLANNTNVAAMVSRMPHPYTAHDAEDFVNRAKQGGIGKRVYAITLAETGTFIGCCGLEPHEDAAVMELGYWLGEPYWNRGYATEAAHMLIDMGFRDFDIDAIDVRCRVVNVASRRVIQKCGFQFQGTGMSPCMALGAFVPVEWYRLDRRTWASLKSWGEGR